MSLVTRCPACATTFKVVRDQLRISDGWVRCGRCSEVFDATADLQEVPESAPAPAAPPAAEAASGAEPSGEFESESESESEPQPELQSEPEPKAPTPPDTPAAPASESPTDSEEADFFDEESQAPPLAAPSEAESKPAPSPEAPERPASPEPLRFIGIVTDEPWLVAEPPLPPPTPLKPSYPPFPKIDLTLPSNGPVKRDPFARPEPEAVDSGNSQFQKALRRAREKSAKARAREQKAAARESAPIVQTASEAELPWADAAWTGALPSIDEREGFWQRRGPRRWLFVLAVAAALLLILQVLHQERDGIVARQPGLRPVFASLCRLTGCELSALRQIRDITIDGASFTREKGGDGYRLIFNLRNRAAVPLAMPAVELSLLDTQERAVVRRVLMPADFGAPAVLPAGVERAVSLPFVLTGVEAAALPPVAGYLVEPFYP
jgi:predicted Zn finger-like uncharacterized protein